MPLPNPPTDQASAARAAHERNAALRAVDDPRQLARAARIIRAALARKALEPADLIEEVGSDAA